jgi:hypothetical protein
MEAMTSCRHEPMAAAELSWWPSESPPVHPEETDAHCSNRTASPKFVGEVNGRQKQAFLGNAAALLFPIDWPEPFGLVMIEAMDAARPSLGGRAASIVA